MNRLKSMMICLAALLWAADASAAILDRIVAIVNDEVITMSELTLAFSPIQKRIDDSYKGPDKDKVVMDTKMSMLNKLINLKLIEQEAKRTGMVVKDEEVNASVKDILTQKKISMTELERLLALDGQTIETYKQEIKNMITRQRLIRKEITAKITVNDEEIGQFYKKHQEEYEGKEAVRLKQILLLVPPNADRKTKERIKTDTETILKRLKNGEAFDLLAARYSQGPAAEEGGDIGFIEKGNMDPAVEAKAFSLKPEEISDIIESSVGFHIIMVIDRRGAGIKSVESVRKEIITRITDEKMDKKVDEWIAGLRKKSLLEIKL